MTRSVLKSAAPQPAATPPVAPEEMRRAIRELEHIDATIRVFDPTYRVEEIKPKTFRPPEDWAKRGQMVKLVMEALRDR